MPDEPIRVFVADDHTILRQGLVRILDMSDAVRVVGQAANGSDAVESILELRPAVALMDINMPKLNGIEAARLLRQQLPQTAVLALTIHDDEQYISEMIRAGARGYILKDSDSETVVQAIQRVAAGESVYPAGLMERVMDRFHQLSAESYERVPLDLARDARGLTPRELEVLGCIVSGHSNKEIADELVISEETVKNHVTSLFRKLEVEDRTQAAVLAVQKGLVR